MPGSAKAAVVRARSVLWFLIAATATSAAAQAPGGGLFALKHMMSDPGLRGAGVNRHVGLGERPPLPGLDRRGAPRKREDRANKGTGKKDAMVVCFHCTTSRVFVVLNLKIRVKKLMSTAAE
jgi:hypothetical protein